MPSIAAHMICAKLVADKLEINDPEFIKGNLLPDIIDIKNSHKKNQRQLLLCTGYRLLRKYPKF